jgi:hypothetical protein
MTREPWPFEGPKRTAVLIVGTTSKYACREREAPAEPRSTFDAKPKKDSDAEARRNYITTVVEFFLRGSAPPRATSST